MSILTKIPGHPRPTGVPLARHGQWPWLGIALLLGLATLIAVGCGKHKNQIDVSRYDYRDTKDLVRYVAGAADVLRTEGLKGLGGPNGYPVRKGDFFLYVYGMDSICILNGGMPQMVGKDLTNIYDTHGRPVGLLILYALNNPDNPHGWAHYSWWEPGKFFPVPKASCNFKVRLPNGREVYVGGGINYPHEEREFVRIVVDSAARLIGEKGTDALAAIRNPTSPYHYRDVRVFAFYPDGQVVISPVVNDRRVKVNLLDCVDEAGNHPFERALKILKTKPVVWQMFMARARDERQLVKKVLYLRKTHLDGKTLYVGAITDLPQTTP